MDIYEILEKLNIKYKEIEHEAVFTVEQAKHLKNKIDGIGCKNLFLKDKNEKYFLLVLEDTKRANINKISKLLNAKHLSFASQDELKNILSLEQGSVTPLGIINDKDNKVVVLFDKNLEGKEILVHPNINTRTISINNPE